MQELRLCNSSQFLLSASDALPEIAACTALRQLQLDHSHMSDKCAEELAAIAAMPLAMKALTSLR